MPKIHQRLILQSRDRNFLIRSSIIIGIISILIGIALPSISTKKNQIIERLEISCPWIKTESLPIIMNRLNQKMVERIMNYSNGKGFDEASIARMAREGLYSTASLLGIPQNILKPETQKLIENYVTIMSDSEKKDSELLLKLMTAAESKKPKRFAAEFYADILISMGKNEESLHFYEIEIMHYPQSDHARNGIMRALLALEKTSKLEELFSNKEYRNSMSNHTFENVASRLGKWISLTKRNITFIFQNLNFVWLSVTTFTATIWFCIIISLGRAGNLPLIRIPLYGFGFIAGFVSTFVVLGLVFWQENELQFKLNGEIINDSLYVICGIGLREELIKLLFFTPFLFILLKRRCPMEALATAACIGLGFACSENLLYFGPGSEAAVFPRFLTANFFHASLTGIAGLSLFYFSLWPKTRWEGFIGTFILVVTAHGAYDALVGLVPQLAKPLSIFSIIIFALISNYYLNSAKEVREGSSAAISPLGIFVIGSSTLIGITWILACHLNPIREVITTIGHSTLSLGAMAFIFINQFRNE
jgi:RsiW-degrading membrane proteinase PrsW (M82 family)